jgi:hypothetical protein
MKTKEQQKAEALEELLHLDPAGEWVERLNDVLDGTIAYASMGEPDTAYIGRNLYTVRCLIKFFESIK